MPYGITQERLRSSEIKTIKETEEKKSGRNDCLTTATFSVTERSSSRSLEDPFFDQGEEVRICIDYVEDFSDFGVSWGHGIIPDFGAGWDMTAFQPDSALISSNAHLVKWHDKNDADCYPSTSPHFQTPGICTYLDTITGRLTLCNTSCEFCPCSGPLPMDTRLPSGWFWSTNGGGIGCTNTCKPNTKFGIGLILSDLSLCFDMKVRTFLSNAEIENNTGLNINIQATSDDQTGCWNDVFQNPIEAKQFGPNWSIACSPSSSVILGKDTIICTGSSPSMEISNENPLDSNGIIVKTIFNNKVTGNRDHYFDQSYGVINDTLVNTTDTIQEVLYTVASVSDTIWCPIVKDTFRVIVYPNITFSVDEVVYINHPVELTSNFDGKWIISDTSIADINNGLLTGLKDGIIEISLVEPISKCTSDIKIVTILQPTYLLKVFTFTDNDGNGIYDPINDSELPNTSVYLPRNNSYYYTNALGNAGIVVDTGLFEIIYKQTTGDWIDDQIVSYINIEELCHVDSIGFIPQLPRLTGITTIPTSWLRCSSTVKLYNRVLNTSSRNMDAKLVVLLDTLTNASNAVPVPNMQESHRFEWMINGLKPSHYFNAHIFVNIPAAMTNMDSLHFYAFLITNEGDTISRFKSSDIIRCSYDPNDKKSWPDRKGEENYTLRSERIDYNIRFQNNGNDTAFYVKIVDVLDPSLDKKSLIVNGSSHDVNTYILGDTLFFEFNEIILPDTASNFLESQGFVSFSFASLPDIAQGTVILNKGDIIFDQNPPIITNQVRNTIVDELPCPLEAIWLQDQTIQVNADGTVYEWYDCGTNALIATTSVPSFVPELTGSYYAVITGDFCKTVTECVTYIISSTAEVKKSTVIIFPNPNDGIFTVSASQNLNKIMVVDIAGRNVYFDKSFTSNTTNHQIDITHLSPGFFLVKVWMGGEIYIAKIVLK
jgi:uncharacterized repeat protein (TIGR01451 family)